MLSKLATLTTAFVLALSVAAFASPVDLDFGEQPDGSAGTVDRADRIGEYDQDEQGFVLYLGPVEPQEEIFTDAEDRRVN